MIDPKIIRNDPEGLKAALTNRGIPLGSIKEQWDESKINIPLIIQLDAQIRKQETAIQEAVAEQKTLSKEYAKLVANGEAEGVIAKTIKKSIDTLKIKTKDKPNGYDAERFTKLLMSVPNIPDPSVPVGKNEKHNVEVRQNFVPPVQVHGSPNHVQIGEKFGMMDFEQTAKVSGSGYVTLKGDLARLERAIGAFMLDENAKRGYVEHSVPNIVTKQAMEGTGQLPKFARDLFCVGKKPYNDDPYGDGPHIEFDPDYYLIPTAEVSLTNLVRERVINTEEFPIRMQALTPCYRSEAGASGLHTNGMIRLHQFNKVELVTIAHPDKSDEEHEYMLETAEIILNKIGLPYRVMLLCTGDMGFSAKKTYDLEVFLPSQDTYREISSVSNCGDFQARRMDARYKLKGKGTGLVHTLNGSGLAVGRTLVAIMENFYTDGGIVIPHVLIPYMGGQTFIYPIKS